jgi:hypothetical protein
VATFLITKYSLGNAQAPVVKLIAMGNGQVDPAFKWLARSEMANSSFTFKLRY